MSAGGFSDARCSHCGATRLLNIDGTLGVCSFIPCPDPFADVRREHPAFLPEWIGTLPNGERRPGAPSSDTIIAVAEALRGTPGPVVRVEANDATIARLFGEGRLTAEPPTVAEIAEITLRRAPTVPDGFAFVVRRCPCGREPNPLVFAPFLRTDDACERCGNVGETFEIIKLTAFPAQAKVMP